MRDPDGLEASYRNALVFLAADAARLQDPDEAVRRYLAWKSILEDREALNLDPHQVRTAERQKESADETVQARIPETFVWLLVPVQRKPRDPVEWEAIRLQGSLPLAVRTSRRLIDASLLYPQLGARCSAWSWTRCRSGGATTWRSVS